ncbi:ATP10 protein [Ekhidna lutea]|uniref:ATP10 protein n=1 Tax=Ekhidna lutea TaxID=447679 RepID=A0A239GL31_EKHLU|nr:hypothetical protein [Ekhidna lutea]SNS69183.1 ATP10 protein [Ekhidna lutea]
MKKILTLITLTVFTSSLSFAQVGNSFPTMEAESLTNEFVDIPSDISGKYSLIGLAYSKKAEDYLKGWFEPVYNQFIYKNPNPGPFDFSFDVHTYFVPMFTGAKRPAYKKVMNKLKKTIDQRLQPNVLFYKGTLKEYKEALNFDGKDLPYFYVLDPEGKIVYATSGRYTKTKMQEITDAVERVMEMD